MLARVVIPVTAQQGVGIITGSEMITSSHLSLLGDTRNRGVCVIRENKPHLGSVSPVTVLKTQKNRLVPECENKCLKIALFAKIWLESA